MTTVITDSQAIGNVAANAQRLMRELGLSIRQLAEKTGESRMSIHRAVNGTNEPGIAVIAKLAEAFGVRVDDLLSPRKIRRKVS